MLTMSYGYCHRCRGCQADIEIVATGNMHGDGLAGMSALVVGMTSFRCCLLCEEEAVDCKGKDRQSLSISYTIANFVTPA